jgi:peptidoglycan/xylan/chitin deacetylase (PgdA/CDA1 family)
MDNPYYGWSPLPLRPPLRWPDGARVAFCVIVSLERTEWLPPRDAYLPPSAVRFGPYPDVLDVHEISTHEYGNRVGVFRVMDVLERHGLRATAAVDAAFARNYPFIVERVRDRGWDFIGHGVSFSRAISSEMSEDTEREYIRESLEAVRDTTGSEPRGWLGPDYIESARTVRLLAEAGVEYVCDWPNDEQPYRMTVPEGTMISLPVTLDLDEVFTHRERGVSMPRWLQLVTEAFDGLYEDGAESGRLIVMNVHPYLIGQPFRIGYLDQALTHIMRRQGVWSATAGEIVDWYAQTSVLQ